MRASQPQDWNSFSIMSALALSWGVPTLLAAEAMSRFQSLWSWALSRESNFCSLEACWASLLLEKPSMAGLLSSAPRAARERVPASAEASRRGSFADHGRRMGKPRDTGGRGMQRGLDDTTDTRFPICPETSRKWPV